MYKAGFSALAAMAFAAIAPVAANAKVVSHFNSNGAYATAYFGGDKYDGKYGNLYVSQGGSAQSTQTYLEYYSSSCDTASWSCQGISGSGPIPNKSFVPGAKSSSLSVNLSGLPGFYAVKWSYDKSTGSYSESPIDLGSISVSWKSSGIYSQKFIGTSTSTYLNTTWKSTGQSSSSDAFASGYANGEQWTSVYGNIGTNSNNERYMERN